MCTPSLYRFELVPVEGQDVSMVYGLVTEPRQDIKVYLRQRAED